MGLFDRTPADQHVELGKRYRDQITGFEGVATGIFVYLYGCRRVQLSGTDRQTGNPADFCFDEPVLELVEEAKPLKIEPEPKRRSTGGPHDRVAPPRIGTR